MTTARIQPVDWEGARNGWLVRPGLYRMARPEWLTAHGWQDLADAGVSTLVDLRTAPEVARHADDDLAAETLGEHEPRRLHLPLEDVADTDYWQRNAPYPMHPAAYPDMVETFGDRIAVALQTVLDAWTAGEKVAVHCTAGRDRTGLLLALLLQLPDIPGGSADWEEQAQVYTAGAAGINEHHRTSGIKHPYESYQPPEEFAENLQGRLASLKRFLADWPAERVARLLQRTH